MQVSKGAGIAEQGSTHMVTWPCIRFGTDICSVPISGALWVGIQLMSKSMFSAEDVGEVWAQKVRKRGYGH